MNSLCMFDTDKHDILSLLLMCCVFVGVCASEQMNVFYYFNYVLIVAV